MSFNFKLVSFCVSQGFTTSPYSYPYLNSYRGSIAGSAGRRRVDRDRDFLGSLSTTRGGGASGSDMDFSLFGGNSTANSSSPLTLSTEDLSITGKVNANASMATPSIKEENQESSYHQQEHKQS